MFQRIRLCWVVMSVVCAVKISLATETAPQGINLAALEGWDIVLTEDATPAEQYAAEELQNLLAACTGRKLAINRTVSQPDAHIFVGAGQAMRASKVGFNLDSLGAEDPRIVARDNNIAIAGGRPRGTLYGVYVFLEDYLGVRFLTADHTHTPRVETAQFVAPVDRSYHPPLRFRWSYYGETNGNSAFAARRRCNTTTGDAKLGGKTGFGLISHTFGTQIPSAKYGQEHPEYFALIDGKRIAPGGNDYVDTEPCLTNPDVLKIVTAAVLADLKADPDRENISVSQNDNSRYCRCPNCQAIDEREGTPMGSLLTFVNSVADEVAKHYPNVKVGTLSYWYTRKPPKTIKPRPNVQIQLCSIECCMMHPISDPNCPKNVEFCRDMDEWGKICSDISVWNYNTNFSNYLLPCPNLRVIEPNILYFLNHNAKGVFMQAAGDALGAEMSDLRNYVMSGLLWDPNRSGQHLVDEFLHLHYGKAAEPIRRFLTLTHDNATAKQLHHNCFGQAKHYGIDESISQAGVDAFAEAMRLADDEVTRSRVEKASICAWRAAVEPCWYASEKLDPALAERMRPMVKTLFDLCHKHGVTKANENRPVEDAVRQLKTALGIDPSAEF